jgi:hypothetical protein
VFPVPLLGGDGLHFRFIVFLLFAFILDFDAIILLLIFTILVLLFLSLRFFDGLAITLGDSDTLFLGRLSFLRDFFLDVLAGV